MSRIKHVLEHSQQYGVESLSTAELLTLVLCSEKASRQREKVLQLIQHIVADHHGYAILSTDIHELFAHEFDEKLAHRLVALLELYRRLARPADQPYRIGSPRDAARLVMTEMRQLTTEQMRILVLDTQNQVVLNQIVYQGTANGNVLRAAEIFRPAIVRNCPAILLCHNHPSGDPTPSLEDVTTTEQLVLAGQTLDIELVDHLVIGESTYISLRERLNWK